MHSRKQLTTRISLTMRRGNPGLPLYRHERTAYRDDGISWADNPGRYFDDSSLELSHEGGAPRRID
jgi:hypothetical protein